MALPLPDSLRRARNWLQAQWLSELDIEGCVDAGKFHEYLVSIDAPVALTVDACANAGWITPREAFLTNLRRWELCAYFVSSAVMGEATVQPEEIATIAGSKAETQELENPPRERDNAGPFNDVLRFANEHLVGRQSKLVRYLCDKGGAVPLSEVLAFMEWSSEKNFEATQGRANKELKRIRWKVSRRDNQVRLAPYGNPTHL